MAHKSKVLIIGGTGYIGKFIVEASAKSGHPTFALVRESTVSDPVKGKIVENFKNLGVTLLHVRILNFLSLSLCVFFVRWVGFVVLKIKIKMGIMHCREIFTTMGVW